ncbi:MAG: serine/threonine protein kinase, partial [Planctomycetes bacterium]|nr:serine/threonine protein kinase [Planctomycetota bacterium]
MTMGDGSGGLSRIAGSPPGGDTTRRNPPGYVLPLPLAAVPPARRVGGYELLAELGRGGMGSVWRARSLALGREVALKLLTAPDDPELVERFQLEARAAARLRHPNVVGVHEVGQDGRTWFLALDLVEGESLRARVTRDGPLSPREAARVVEAIGRALHHAHGHGVVHRDVKPHNILIAADGTPLLADFGLAKDAGADGLTVTGQVLGTPAYMAPEQALGDLARVDRRADVYALGATLYEALTGAPPFAGATAMNILRQVIEDDPAPPSRRRPGLDRDLEAVVLKCLEKAPDARYDTAAQAADDLARWLRREPVAARRAG